MTGDAWKVGFPTNEHPSSDKMRPPHETAVLHELIIQAVTERRIDANPNQAYDTQLEATIKRIQGTDAYKSLIAKPNFIPSEIAGMLDKQGLQRLPVPESSQHVTLMMATGGPATGKTVLIERLRDLYPTTYSDAAKINPDDYKPLLVDKAKFGKHYADVAHEESSQLANKIIGRLEEKIAVGRAPNIVMDVVAANDRRMQLANQTGLLIVVAGTAPPEVTVPRAFERGEKPGGRSVPTEVVLDGARKAAATAPAIFSHPAAIFELVDTNVPYGTPSKSVAHLERNGTQQTLRINRPDTFIDFVERQNLNVKAASPEQLYKPQDRMPQSIAEGLKAYLDRGVRLEFLNANGEVAMAMSSNGVEQNKPLVIASRGLAFMPEVAAATTMLLTRQGMAEQKRPSVEEHARSETKAPIRTGAAYGAAIPAGVGTGMGIHGLYDAAQPNSSVRRDLNAGGVQAVAGGARVTAQAADVVIGTAATIEGTRRALSHTTGTVAGIANKLPELGPAGKLASRAAIPIAVTTGALDMAAGIAEHNPERVSGAVGRTGGGIWGGIEGGAAAGALWGLAGGSPSGPGALVTAGLGALGGAVVGGFIGEEGAKEITRRTMSLFDAKKPEPTQPFPPLAPRPAMVIPPLSQSNDISPDMLKALNAAMGAGLSSSIRCDAHQPTTSSLPASQAVPKQQTQNTSVCR